MILEARGMNKTTWGENEQKERRGGLDSSLRNFKIEMLEWEGEARDVGGEPVEFLYLGSQRFSRRREWLAMSHALRGHIRWGLERIYEFANLGATGDNIQGGFGGANGKWNRNSVREQIFQGVCLWRRNREGRAQRWRSRESFLIYFLFSNNFKISEEFQKQYRILHNLHWAYYNINMLYTIIQSPKLRN